MKRFIVLTSLLLSASAFAYTYVITDGMNFDGTLSDHETLLMTGGGELYRFARMEFCGYPRDSSL